MKQSQNYVTPYYTRELDDIEAYNDELIKSKE